MNLRKFATISLLVLSSFAANNVAPSKAELDSMYEKAFKEFNATNYDAALKDLDAIDARQPDLAESANLRGVICMRQQKYDDAEKALQKALASDPKFWNAKFNLAEIPFLRKNWTEARNRFQALLFGNDLQLQGEALQLIQYKILLTYLLEGKENMVDGIMAKLELAPDTPAVHYANAAIAFNKKDEAEAKKWLGAAEKNFSPQLNKLFAESIYEVGWMEKPAGQTRAAVELTSAADRAAKAKAFAKSKFEQAEQAFQQRDYTAAKKAIDEADAADPNHAAYVNLRGEILLAQNDFAGAENAFRQAQKIDPKLREAAFNLAQVPFKQKDYKKARERLDQLFSGVPKAGADKDQMAQLIRFKIYLTLLLEGKDSAAQKMMEQFQFTGDTPALYYAQAAWEFKHNNAPKANDWVTSARKIYSPAMNMVFADSLYDVGWLQQNAPAAQPQQGKEIAKADASPSVEPTAIPGAAQAAKSPAQVASARQQASPAASGNAAVPGMEATTQSSPAMALAQNVPPAATPAAASAPTAPVVETPVAAREPEQIAAASQPPVIGETNIATATATASVHTTPAASVAPTAASIVATSVTATPATVLAPAKVREWSEPSTSDKLSKYFDANTLLVGGMLLAGVLILARVAMPAFRNRSRRAEPVHAPATAAGPRFSSSTPAAVPQPVSDDDERLVGGAFLPGAGPRQVSLQLKATEPSTRRSAVPFIKSTRPIGTVIGSEPSVGVAAIEQPSLAPAALVGAEIGDPQEHSANGNGSEHAGHSANGNGVSAFAAPPIESRTVQEQIFEPEVVEPPVAPSFQPQPESLVPADSFLTETAHISAPPSVSTESADSDVAFPEDSRNYESAPPEGGEALQGAPGSSTPEPPVFDGTVRADAVTTTPLMEEVAPARPMAAEFPPVVEPHKVAARAESFEPIGQGQPIPHLEAASEAASPGDEIAEPIGQGQPIPHLEVPAESFAGAATEAASAVAPGRESEQPSRIARAFAAGAALVGIGSLRRSTPSASSEPELAAPEPEPASPEPAHAEPAAAATEPEPEPLIHDTTPTIIMAQPNQPTATPAIRTSPQSPIQGGMSVGAPQPQPQTQAAGGMQTAVQLSFAFEIASLQLTPSFRMGALQLRPVSRVVSMRLAPTQQQQQSPMNLQVNFEIANVQLAGNSLGMIRLTPSQQQRPNMTGSSAFNIGGLQVLGGDNASVQLTPSQQAAVQLTGRFQIATVEFSPTFEIAALVLNSASRSVHVQLPGAPGAVEQAPVFDIANVQLGGGGEIAMMYLAPQGGQGGMPAGMPRPA